MPVNIQRDAEMWAEEEIGKQSFGEDFGYAVTLQLAAVQTPQGMQQVPMWTLFLTCRNPVLAEGPLYHGPVPVGSPKPDEKVVRGQVTEGLRLLRVLARSKLAVSNGHSLISKGA
jgi:hypothetical protein